MLVTLWGEYIELTCVFEWNRLLVNVREKAQNWMTHQLLCCWPRLMVSEHQGQKLLHGNILDVFFYLIDSLCVADQAQLTNLLNCLFSSWWRNQELVQNNSEWPHVRLQSDVFLVHKDPLRSIIRQSLLDHVFLAVRRNQKVPGWIVSTQDCLCKSRSCLAILREKTLALSDLDKIPYL